MLVHPKSEAGPTLTPRSRTGLRSEPFETDDMVLGDQVFDIRHLYIGDIGHYGRSATRRYTGHSIKANHGRTSTYAQDAQMTGFSTWRPVVNRSVYRNLKLKRSVSRGQSHFGWPQLGRSRPVHLCANKGGHLSNSATNEFLPAAIFGV